MVVCFKGAHFFYMDKATIMKRNQEPEVDVVSLFNNGFDTDPPIVYSNEDTGSRKGRNGG